MNRATRRSLGDLTPNGPLRKPGFLTRGRCIGALNRRKSFCQNDLMLFRGVPRCRQSVAATCSVMKSSKGRQVVAAFDGGEVTSDAGALLLGATDRAIGLVTRFAACFDDSRVQAQVEHTVESMVAQRVFGIALGYEDLVDHDQLRHDPVLATLAGKLTARRKRLRAARRQEHAQPARASAIGTESLPQDRPRRRGDRGFVRQPLPRGAQDTAREDHSRSRRHGRPAARASGGPVLPRLLI